MSFGWPGAHVIEMAHSNETKKEGGKGSFFLYIPLVTTPSFPAQGWVFL